MRRTMIAGFSAAALSAVILLSGFDSAMTPQDLQAKAADAKAGLNSATIEIAMKADVSLEMGSDPSTATKMPMAGDANVTVSYVLDPFQMKMDMDFSGSALGQSGSGRMAEYLILNEDGTGSAYTYAEGVPTGQTGTESAAGSWTRSEIPADQMSKVTDAVKAAQAGDYSTAKENGIDVQTIMDSIYGNASVSSTAADIGGKECYELISPISGKDLIPVFDQIMNSSDLSMNAGMDAGTTKQIMDAVLNGLNINMTTDYSTEDFLPVHADMDLSGSDFSWFGDLIAQASSGAAAGSGSSQIPQMSFSINTLKASADYDFETPVVIEVPEEAKSAPEISAQAAAAALETDAAALETDTAAAGATAGEESEQGAAGDTAAAASDPTKPQANADGTYSISIEDISGNTHTVNITAPEGYTAQYQGNSMLVFEDSDYNDVEYIMTAYGTPEEMIGYASDISYYESESEFTDVSVSEPKEITLGNGNTATLITMKYTDTAGQYSIAETTAMVFDGELTVQVKKDVFGEAGEAPAEPTDDEMKAFCECVAFQK